MEQQVRESQGQLAGIVASALDAFITIDTEQRVVLFNPAAEKMFGCSAADAIGNSIDRFIPERFRAVHAVHIHRFGETGTTNRAMGTVGLLWGLRSNGEEFPIEASISHAQSQGKHLFTVIIRDITERRSMEEAKRQSEERLQLAFQAGKMYAYEWDTATDTIIRSPACKEVLGSDHPTHLSQRALLSSIHPQDRPKLAAFFDGITPENTTSRVNYRLLRSDGSVIWLEKSARAFFDNNGKLLRTVGVVVDITDRKQAEQSLVEGEERFRLVANTAPVLIWMTGPDKLCTYVNRPWREFTGRPLEAAHGHGWTESVHPDDLDECWNTFSQAVDRMAPFTMQYRLRRHDGEYRWVLNTGLPRFNANHSIAGYIGSCIDITDRKLAEEALGSIGRRLIEAHEEERAWIARELHDDVNQRLALLTIELQRVKDIIPESEIQVRERVDQTRTRLTEISKDVQALSHRLHSSKLEYLGIVVAASGFCRELADRHKVTIEFNHSDIPPTLSKEVSLCLFRVLQEALQNAVKHSSAQQFRVELKSTDEEIRLTVSDSGVGFDWRDAMRGRGLGLISMRERLQLMKGRFSIESERGRGTTISAWVPLGEKSYPASMAG
jgi:PAS domain S-box-containing protein